MRPRGFLLALVAVGLMAPLAQAAQVPRGSTRAATFPSTGATTRGARLVATIVEVVGLVQARNSEREHWVTARVGMRLDEGAEFRTGPRSRVVFTIPPDQKVTLDRLGVVKLLEALQGPGVVRTNLGMQYGRTVYEVQEAGIEHDATIQAPGMTLAVRGTENMSVFDQGSFAPVAVAYQPVFVIRDGKRIPFGKAGRRDRMRADTNSPGETYLDEGKLDPAGKFSGRSGEENELLTYLQQVAPGVDTSQFPLLRTLTDPNFQGGGIGTLPIPGQLEFAMIWSATTPTNIDLIIRSPLGEILSPQRRSVASSGVHNGNGRSNGDSIGQETALWTQGYPRGQYTVTAQWRSGGPGATTVQVKRDPQTAGEVVALFQGRVSQKNPRLTRVVTIEPPASAGAAEKSAARRRATGRR